MTAIAILIPVLGRPARVQPLIQSIAASSRFISCFPIFLVSRIDLPEREAISAARLFDEDGNENLFPLLCDWEPGTGDYARKINRGIEWALLGDFEFFLLGADDLVFHPGWAERALACYLETHACVIGTNDIGNETVKRGDHSTHPLVHRDYVECGTIDEPDSGKLLHEGYDHNWVDAEFVQTAIHRETWAHATDSVVEHLHPLWKKSEGDATYDKGQMNYHTDRDLYNARRRLWGGS